jgi:hypothetical protein
MKSKKSKSEQWLGGASVPKGNGHFLHFFVEMDGTLYQVDTETGEKTFVAPKNENEQD